MQTVVPVIPNGFWFATPENEWQQLFWRHLPSWMTLSDLSVLQDFYDGDTTFYTTRYLAAWWEPILWWTIFLSVVIWVMICIDLLLRKQWIERERLTYPIVRLPIEMTYSDGRLFKNKMLWAGFAIAASIDLINGIHAFFPTFPEIPVRKADLGIYFTEKPWSAIGWTPIYILSFGVGLAFLMPLEMSFSLWFFYLFWKGERVLGSAMGLQVLPGFPYDGPQGVGAYLAIACFGLYGGRKHFYAMFRNLAGKSGTNLPPEMQDTTDYRWPLAGLIGGVLFLSHLFKPRRNGSMDDCVVFRYLLSPRAGNYTGPRRGRTADTRDVCGKPAAIYSGFARFASDSTAEFNDDVALLRVQSWVSGTSDATHLGSI